MIASAAMKALKDNGWSLICVNMATGGDDYEITWNVVSYHMAEPKARVIGWADEDEGPIEAIRRAVKIQRHEGDFLFEYKGSNNE